MKLQTMRNSNRSQSAHEGREMADTKGCRLSVEEIGKSLGVSSDTVYRWIDKHTMPVHRMGCLWQFKQDEVNEWVKTGSAADKARQDQAE